MLLCIFSKWDSWLYILRSFDYRDTRLWFRFPIFVHLQGGQCHFILGYIRVFLRKGSPILALVKFQCFLYLGITTFDVLFRCFSLASYCCVSKKSCSLNAYVEFKIWFIIDHFSICFLSHDNS